eukprot:3287939-Amphidinium_carterae.1
MRGAAARKPSQVTVTTFGTQGGCDHSTSGCCGWKVHSAISLDFNEWGSSIFLPPVSLARNRSHCTPKQHRYMLTPTRNAGADLAHLPLFKAEIRQAARPQRTKPMGE